MVSRAFDPILSRLGAGTTSAAALEQALGRSPSWVNAALRGLIDSGRVVRIGSRRGARYGLRREIAGSDSAWPLHRVGRDGEFVELGTLHALAANEYYLEASTAALAGGFAVPPLNIGIPYLLQDQRPGGFLGRAVPSRYPELSAPPRVRDWSDEHYLRYLTAFGSDEVGDLILGRAAFDRYVAQARVAAPIDAGERARHFPQLAEAGLRAGLPGSSPHGEHPKFAVTLLEHRAARPVLVKFSPPIGEPVGQRWSDLLIAEHCALETLRAAGVASASSRLFQLGGRTFLEVDRFDRSGAIGRIGVTSLLAIDASLYGRLDNWIASADRLCRARRIDASTLEQIRLLSSFGDLIANTDKHFGNLAFFDSYDGRFGLAPVYDMLPMLFAPEHEELVARTFSPTVPSAETLSVWARARALAEGYWRTLALDEQLSADFRRISRVCLEALEALPRTGPYAPR